MTSPSGWIDVSIPLHTGMAHWPDNTPFSIDRDMDMGQGDPATVSRIRLGVHTGTHMDAPMHFFGDGASMDSLPFEAVIGRARIIAIDHRECVQMEELQAHNIRAGERILFKTANSARAWKAGAFVKDFVYISKEAAQFLADKKILTVGVDYLSVGGFYKDGPETHHALLGAGIWIIEGLNLSEVEPGNYELVCLPLRLAGSEGSPARAILRREQ